jgi:DNA-binding transcriptional MerR regulator
MPDGTYSLGDLCGLAGVTPRTVRYYISQGLLRSPGTSGPGARYDDGHLSRLRLVRRLQREHLPLAEIRARLAALTDDEAIAQAEGPTPAPADSALDYVRAVLGGRTPRTPPATRTPDPAFSSPAFSSADMSQTGPMPAVQRELRVAEDAPGFASPAAPERSHWVRIALAPNVELHVRRPLTRSQNRAVARLLETARRLLEEDQP